MYTKTSGVLKYTKVPIKVSVTIVSLLFPQHHLESRALCVPDQSAFFFALYIIMLAPKLFNECLLDALNCTMYTKSIN